MQLPINLASAGKLVVVLLPHQAARREAFLDFAAIVENDPDATVYRTNGKEQIHFASGGHILFHRGTSVRGLTLAGVDLVVIHPQLLLDPDFLTTLIPATVSLKQEPDLMTLAERFRIP